MQETRVRVQLQTGDRDVVPAVVIHHIAVSYLTVAMMVRTIAENAVGHRIFTKKKDGEACIKAAFKLVSTLERAMIGKHTAGDGNRYREEFRAHENGKPAIYRLDVEVRAGQLCR